MVTELNSDLLGMGLGDDQEAYILHRIDEAIVKAKKQLDASSMLYVVFSSILQHLNGMTSKQQFLVDTFSAMNAVMVSVEVEDDGSIVMF